MKTRLYILLVLSLLFVACNKGIWLNNTAYRPKLPHYKLLQTAFEWNPQIDTQFVYVAKHPFVSYDNDSIYGCLYFYADGSMAIDQLNTQHKNKLFSHQQAPAVGYYRTKDKLLTIEVFMPGQGGYYLQRTASIEKDQLLFKEGNFISTNTDTLQLNRTKKHQ